MIEKFLKKKFKLLGNEKGLTLIELLAVVVILGIIAAIAVPAIGKIIDNSRYKAVKADALNALNAAQLYYSDTSTTASVSVDILKTNGYIENVGKLATGMTVAKDSTTNELKITGTSEEYSTGKRVDFTSASVTKINESPNTANGATGASITGN